MKFHPLTVTPSTPEELSRHIEALPTLRSRALPITSSPTGSGDAYYRSFYELNRSVKGSALSLPMQRVASAYLDSKGIFTTHLTVRFTSHKYVPYLDRTIHIPHNDDVEVASLDQPVDGREIAEEGLEYGKSREQLAKLLFRLVNGYGDQFNIVGAGHFGLPTVKGPDNPLQSA